MCRNYKILFCSIPVYNLGEYRRSVTTAYKNHEFFRSENQAAMAIRTECALRALEDACKWLSEKGEVAVSDGNSLEFISERQKNVQISSRSLTQLIQQWNDVKWSMTLWWENGATNCFSLSRYVMIRRSSSKILWYDEFICVYWEDLTLQWFWFLGSESE